MAVLPVSCILTGQPDWRLGIELNLWWGNYFDDFPCISHRSQLSSTKSCVEGLFQLISFKFAQEKLTPFSESSEMLGVVVDTSEKGVVTVDNKESRKRDLVTEIQKILELGCLRVDTLPSILGRVQYAELRISGREGKLAMADDTCRHAFEILLSRIDSGDPKEFLVMSLTNQFSSLQMVQLNQVLTVELINATVGGVIIADGVTEVFESRVDQQVLEGWLVELVDPVGLTELYGVAVAFSLWRPLLQGRRIIFFCDNWTAIDVYVRGSSPLRFGDSCCLNWKGWIKDPKV